MKNIEEKRVRKTEMDKHERKEKRGRRHTPHIRLFFMMGLAGVWLFFWLFAGTGVASATDYYVATWGSDSGSGTIEEPWQHPSYAAQQAEAGDTIYLVDGTWYDEYIVFANSGTEGNPIIMTAHNGTPTLNGVDESGIAITINKEHIHITNLKIEKYLVGIYPTSAANHICISDNTIDTKHDCIEIHGDNIKVHNNILQAQEVTAVGQSTQPYKDGLIYSDNTVLGSGWNGLTFTASRNSIAFGNSVTGTHHNGMQIGYGTGAGAFDNTFKNNTVYNVSDNCYYITWDAVHPETKIINTIIEDCVARDNAGRGIVVDGGVNSTIRRFYTRNVNAENLHLIRAENTHIIDSLLEDRGDIVAYLSSNTKIINTQFNDTSSISPEEADLTVYYYLDVLVQDEKGNPIHGAKVTVPPFDVTVDYYDIPLTVTPINLQVIPREYTEGLLDAQPITETYTGTDGHTPLPSDNGNTLVIAAYRKDEYNYPTGPTIKTDFDKYTITAEKDEATVTVTGIVPDKSWYREDPNTNPEVGKGTIIITLPTLQDTVPPYTSAHNPAKDVVGIAKDTNIVVHVKDDGAGVDQSSIIMTVEGNQVTPTITGTPGEYTLAYAPLADFDYGQVVDVTVDAQDLASPPNVTSQDRYSPYVKYSIVGQRDILNNRLYFSRLCIPLLTTYVCGICW